MMIGYGQDLKFSTYYHHKKTLFDELPNTENEIIFLGNSITDMGSWAEFFQIQILRIEELVVILRKEYCIEFRRLLNLSHFKYF